MLRIHVLSYGKYAPFPWKTINVIIFSFCLYLKHINEQTKQKPGTMFCSYQKLSPWISISVVVFGSCCRVCLWSFFFLFFSFFFFFFFFSFFLFFFFLSYFSFFFFNLFLVVYCCCYLLVCFAAKMTLQGRISLQQINNPAFYFLLVSVTKIKQSLTFC